MVPKLERRPPRMNNQGMRRTRSEQGGVVKWVITLVVVGVILFDAGSIIVNIFRLDSTAGDIANQLSLSANYNQNNNKVALEREAEELVKAEGAKLIEFDVGVDKVIRLTIRRQADTVVVGRIKAIKNWGRATADGQASATN